MKKNTNKNIETFQELINLSNYSFIEKLNSDLTTLIKTKNTKLF